MAFQKWSQLKCQKWSVLEPSFCSGRRLSQNFRWGTIDLLVRLSADSSKIKNITSTLSFHISGSNIISLALGHKICRSHYYGPTVRARKLKFSGKIALGMTILQNSEKLETVAMETWESGIAGFQPDFRTEVPNFGQRIFQKPKQNIDTNIDP